jgi:transcriptional regulator with XRE-family HTH domain
MKTAVTLQERIWELIDEHVTARDVAEATGVHESVLSRIKNGKLTPGPEVLRKLGLVAETTYRRLTDGETCGGIAGSEGAGR